MAYTKTPKPSAFVTVGLVVTSIYTKVARAVTTWTKTAKPE